MVDACDVKRGLGVDDRDGSALEMSDLSMMSGCIVLTVLADRHVVTNE